MDLSCIISSGDLELYVLGLLPEEEAYKIQQLALLFPEVEEEVNRITEALVQAANASDIAPRALVKEALMNELNASASVTTSPVISVTEATGPIEQSAPVVSINQSKNRFGYLVAASTIGVLVFLGLVIYLINQNHAYQNRLTALQQQVDTLHQSNEQQQQQMSAYATLMNMMQDDRYVKVKMNSVGNKPPALVHLFWNKQTHDVYVADMSLPAPPADKQYQLWAIVDGKPVDAGMLSPAKDSVQQMKPFDKADAFAITLENKGGSPTPTMEAMYVMGKVS